MSEHPGKIELLLQKWGALPLTPALSLGENRIQSLSKTRALGLRGGARECQPGAGGCSLPEG